MNKIITKEFIAYCLVGLVNTFVGISTAFVCLNFLLLSYAISTGMSYVFGIIVSFFLNKKYTFKNKDKLGMQFVKFFSTMLPAYIVSYWAGYELTHLFFKYGVRLLNLLTEIINIPQDRTVDNISVLCSMAIYLIVGFSVNKFIVFKNKNINK